MIDNEYILKIAEEKLQGSDLFVADIKNRTGNVIHVFLDGDRGVTIEDCVKVSKHINAMLGEGEDYELTVSSFGADQPLKMPRQYIKNIGRSLTVKLIDDQTVTGVLESIREDGITLRPELKKKKKGQDSDQPEKVFVQFDMIEKAKVNISFNQ